MRGQIIRRGEGRYLVRAPIGRDATGKRRYHNKTIHGTKRTAQEYLARILREMDLGEFVEYSHESLSDYLRRWLSDVVARRVRERTLEDYQQLAARHLLPRLGHFKLSQITPERIEACYSAMSRDGLSPRTVRYAHSVLHGSLEHAVERGHLARNPAKKAVLPRQENREMRALSQAEALRFAAAIRGTRLEALWYLLLAGGLRPGEALGLKWGDLEGERLHIQRTLVFLKSGEWRLTPPKTSRSRRAVVLPPSALALLAQHREIQRQERMVAGEHWAENDLVFCTKEGRPLEWRLLAQRYLRPLLASAGLVGLRPYDLRHSCATLLLASGENAKVVSERLGHASVAFTLDVYSHVLPDMQQRAADRIEQLLTVGDANERVQSA